MKPLKKNITLFSLILLTALPLLASCIFVISQIRIQHRMLEELEKANVVSITVAADELQWINEGKEAMIDGKMFDVKEFVVHGSTIELKGLFDKDEDSMLARLNEVQQKNNSDKNNTGTLLVQWLGCFTGIESTTDAINNTSLTAAINYAAWHSNMFSIAVAQKDTPPPKV